MKEYSLRMLTTETKPLDGEFAESLRTGETLSSAAATHTPPSGTALSLSPSVSGTVGMVQFGTGSLVRGWHTVTMLCTGSQGTKEAVVWQINVS